MPKSKLAQSSPPNLKERKDLRMSKPEVKIESWWIAGNHLHGRVQDHPRFEKDTDVTTSVILEVPMLPEEGDRVETRNTIYILGKEA